MRASITDNEPAIDQGFLTFLDLVAATFSSSFSSSAEAVAEAAIEEPPSPRTRVLLADDHAIVRQGLAGLLAGNPEIELVGEAKNGQEAVAMALETRPDVVLMDITMPYLNGIEATRRLTSDLPKTRVIGLSMHEGDDMATAMREAGAVAYLNKGEAADTLIGAILAPAEDKEPSPG